MNENTEKRNVFVKQIVEQLINEYGYNNWEEFFNVLPYKRYYKEKNQQPWIFGRIEDVHDYGRNYALKIKIMKIDAWYDVDQTDEWEIAFTSLVKDNPDFEKYTNEDGALIFEKNQIVLGKIAEITQNKVPRIKNPVPMELFSDCSEYKTRILMDKDIRNACYNCLTEEQMHYPLLKNINMYYQKKRNEQMESEIKKVVEECNVLTAQLQVQNEELEQKQDKIKQKQEEIEKTQQEKNELENSLNQLVEECKTLKDEHGEIENLKEQYETISEKLGKTQVELEKVENQINEYGETIERINCLRNYGFDFWEKDVDKEEKQKAFEETKNNFKKDEVTFNEFISMVEQSVREQGYTYPDRIVARFVQAMYTNQIIILHGPTGTGKTTLPIAVSKAIKGECKTIHVQSNWNDKQDLFGFYNVMEKRYVSTPFLDVLMEARKDPNTMYFVVLDEMNLAVVEYYFAEILSAMETEEKIINLYSKIDYESARRRCVSKIKHMFKPYEDNYSQEESPEEVLEPNTQEKIIEKWADILPGTELDAYYDLVEEWNNLNNYPASFELPKNVQIVGTINMDASTKNISPKVIDRSYLIEICETKEGTKGDNIDTTETLSRENYVSLALFKDLRGINDEKEYFAEVEKALVMLKVVEEDIEKKNEGVSLRISKRGEQRIEEMFMGVMPQESENKGEEKAKSEGQTLDGLMGENENKDASKKRKEETKAHELILEDFVTDMVLGKLLPSIQCNGVITYQDSEIQCLSSEENRRFIKEKLQQMYIDDYKIFDYWR